MSFVIKELDTTYMICNRVHAYAIVHTWWLTQSRLTTSFFNCTPAGRASDEMKATAKTCSIQLVVARCSVFGRAHWSLTVGYLLLQRFSKGLAVEFSSCFNSVSWDLDLYDCCFDA